MFGLLNVNKPLGITSRAAVNHVQRLIRPAKAGHAGTLDPLATGVLLICVGPATRLVPYLQRAPKSYVGTFMFGRESDTEDIQGRMVERPPIRRPTRFELEQVLTRFVGQIEQRPPVYSAIKTNGRRSYDLVREGKPVDLPARTVTIHALRLVNYDYPRWTLKIDCAGGTYVRSLGRDIAGGLETVAVMSALERTQIGNFYVQDACSLDDLSSKSVSSLLIPAARAVAELPRQQLADAERQRVANGLLVENRCDHTAAEVAAVDADGQLLAILVPRDGGLGPSRNFILR